MEQRRRGFRPMSELRIPITAAVQLQFSSHPTRSEIIFPDADGNERSRSTIRVAAWKPSDSTGYDEDLVAPVWKSGTGSKTGAAQ